MSKLNELIMSYIISYHSYIIKRAPFPYVSLLVATTEMISHLKTVLRYLLSLKLFLIFSVVFIKFHGATKSNELEIRKGLSFMYITYFTCLYL